MFLPLINKGLKGTASDLLLVKDCYLERDVTPHVFVRHGGECSCHASRLGIPFCWDVIVVVYCCGKLSPLASIENSLTLLSFSYLRGLQFVPG